MSTRGPGTLLPAELVRTRTWEEKRPPSPQQTELPPGEPGITCVHAGVAGLVLG